MSTGKGKGWHPTPTRFAWVPVGKLNSLKLRPTQPSKVNKIVREFDPDAIGVLHISERTDKSLWILDGNNRKEGVHRLWGPDSQVPCQIYNGLTPADEKRLFVLFNENRTKPHPIWLFLAKVDYDEDAKGVADIVVGKHGLEVTAQPGVARIAAVQCLTTLYAKGGSDVLDTTLTVVEDAWGKHTNSYHQQVMLGVGVLLTRFPNIDRARLTKVLSDTNPKRLVARGQEARHSELDARTDDNKSGSYIARLILAGYNKRLRASAVLTWQDQPSRYYWTESAEYSRLMLQKMSEQEAE